MTTEVTAPYPAFFTISLHLRSRLIMLLLYYSLRVRLLTDGYVAI